MKRVRKERKEEIPNVAPSSSPSQSMTPVQKHSHKKATLEASNNAARQLFAESDQLKKLQDEISRLRQKLQPERLGI